MITPLLILFQGHFDPGSTRWIGGGRNQGGGGGESKSLMQKEVGGVRARE